VVQASVVRRVLAALGVLAALSAVAAITISVLFPTLRTRAGQMVARPRTMLEAFARGYRVIGDVTYARAGGWFGLLDLYVPRSAKSPVPVVIYFHGGGWEGGTKAEASTALLPFIREGFAAANVEYRLSDIATAPAAAQDAACAMNWVVAHAAEYGIDARRIVLAGVSAGGHLALLVAMADSSAHLDADCPVPGAHAAAVVNYYGVAYLPALLRVPDARGFTERWIGPGEGADERARRMSPLTWVRQNGPAVLSIHGDHDELVPYDQSVRLHAALRDAGVPNLLYTVRGGGHGFSRRVQRESFAVVRRFLTERGILPAQHAAASRD
jgi:acetyl esterase/lipase